MGGWGGGTVGLGKKKQINVQYTHSHALSLSLSPQTKLIPVQTFAQCKAIV